MTNPADDPFAAWGEGLMRSWTEQLEDDVETKDVERLREYALEVTKALTNLTGGGSEFFMRKEFGFYTADIQACVERINETKYRALEGRKEAMIEARTLSAQLETERRRSEGLRAGLRNLYFKSSAMQVGIGVHNARHTPNIDGPIVSEFSDAVQAARATLEDTE